MNKVIKASTNRMVTARGYYIRADENGKVERLYFGKNKNGRRLKKLYEKLTGEEKAAPIEKRARQFQRY